MILVVGGLGAGKKSYVMESLGYGEQDFAMTVLDENPVLLGLHEHIRAEGTFPDEWFAPLCQKQVVVCAEVGCGVVPIEAGERQWRDEVGRACARLAVEADTVVRLVCGVPQAIKGVLPCV